MTHLTVGKEFLVDNANEVSVASLDSNFDVSVSLSEHVPRSTAITAGNVSHGSLNSSSSSSVDSSSRLPPPPPGFALGTSVAGYNGVSDFSTGGGPSSATGRFPNPTSYAPFGANPYQGFGSVRPNVGPVPRPTAWQDPAVSGQGFIGFPSQYPWQQQMNWDHSYPPHPGYYGFGYPPFSCPPGLTPLAPSSLQGVPHTDRNTSRSLTVPRVRQGSPSRSPSPRRRRSPSVHTHSRGRENVRRSPSADSHFSRARSRQREHDRTARSPSSDSRSSSSSDECNSVRSISPHPYEKEIECTVQSAFELLKAYRPDLVVEKSSQSSCRTEAERVLEDGNQAAQPTFLAKQSPFIAALLSQLEADVRGEKEPKSGPSSSMVPPVKVSNPLPGCSFDSNLPEVPPVSDNAMKRGTFFKAVSKSRPFPKPSYVPILHSNLPQAPLSLSDACRSALSKRHVDARVKGHIPEKSLKDWEDLARMGLESASLTESVLSVISVAKNTRGAQSVKTMSDRDLRVLLWFMSKTVRSLSDCLARLFFNSILARRDAFLGNASSRLSPETLNRIRALPFDSHSVFGPQVASAVNQANSRAITDQFLSLSTRQDSQKSSKFSGNRKRTQASTPKSSSPAKRQKNTQANSPVARKSKPFSGKKNFKRQPKAASQSQDF